jgi:GT2 family glycosyltransferase
VGACYRPAVPGVWLLVVNWNGAALLSACLDSLRRAAPDAHIVVVDNGSTDRSAAVVAGHPHVEWVPLGANRGFAEANNVILRRALAAGARWIGLVNPDMRVDAEWLARLVAAGEAIPDAGLVQGLVVFEDRPDVVNTTGLSLDALGRASDRDFEVPLTSLRRADGPMTGASGGAVLVRAQMLREIGLFDPAFFAYCEDADLSLRAAAAGWKAYYVSSARAVHGYERSFGKDSPRKKYLLARNHLRVVAAHLPWSRALVLPPVLALARATLRAPAELARGRPAHALAHLRAAGAGLAAVPAILARRARGRRIPPGAEPDVDRRSPARPGGRRALVAAAAVTTALALALGIGSLPWRPQHRTGEPTVELAVAGAGPLLAGAASVDLDAPAGTPIAGFPRVDWASDGMREPLRARALVLEQQRVRVALVSVEILLVSEPLSRAVEAAVKDLALDHVLIAATHTHAGPGGWWDNPIAERVALGPYDDARLTRLAARIALAIREAAAARRPAALAWGSADASHLARNRDGGPVDGRLAALRVTTPGGDPIARVVLFAAHPTLLGSSNRKLSGDWPGALARRERVPVLFFQGPLGDQSAATRGKDRSPERYARRVATALRRARPEAPDPEARIALAVVHAVLPAPDLGASPPLLRRLVRNALYGAFPVDTRVTALRLGPVTLIAVPGEPVAAVGERLRGRVGGRAEILALANDYVGYVETEDEMARGAGETQRTYFGPELAARLEAAVLLAAGAVERAVTAEAPPAEALVPASAPAAVAR